MNESHGLPWKLPHPTRDRRIAFAICAGLVAAALHYFRAGGHGGLSDFSLLWYGSKLLSEGRNPYELIGPHLPINLPSNLYYPAPALIGVMPLVLFPVEVAGAVFVFISASLLAYAITADGWFRIPLLLSVSFFTAARLGQWSMLFTAAFFLPALGFFAIAKPQSSLPVLVASTTRRTLIFAIAGTIVLTAIAFLILPSWVSSWLGQVGSSEFFRAPILSIQGAFIALVLLRWRRAESWLVFSSACLPQTWYPYNALILMVVASTYREASALSLVASAGWLAAYALAPGDLRSPETQSMFRGVLIGLCYLPATILILRRDNSGPMPVWITAVRKLRHRTG